MFIEAMLLAISIKELCRRGRMGVSCFVARAHFQLFASIQVKVKKVGYAQICSRNSRQMREEL